jgi:MoxR-like ATPase
VPLLGHKGEVVRAHDNLLIIADMNPNYRGTMQLNAAFYNRFDFKIPWNYDPVVEAELIHFPTVREVAKKLRELIGQEIMTPVSTNMLMEMEEFCMNPSLGVDFAIQNFVAAFNSTEQSAVARMMELDSENIAKDMKHFINQQKRSASKKPSVENDDELEEIDVEFSEDED